MGLLCLGKIGRSSVLWAIVFCPTVFAKLISIIFLCIYLEFINCHPTYADGGVEMVFIRVSIRPSVPKLVSATPPRRHIRLSWNLAGFLALIWSCAWRQLRFNTILTRNRSAFRLQQLCIIRVKRIEESLCWQLLLDASSDFLETLRVYLLWYKDVHMFLFILD